MAVKPEAKQDTSEDGKENCFIITPIGAIDSETFKKTKGLISSVIAPILEEFNFKAVPAYEINNSGSITKQILKSILNDKLVIANLTSLNPNVMYELAVRHSIRLPIITMAEYGTMLPFDINDQRTIFYHDTLLGSEDAKPRLREAIKASLADKSIDNPIYQVIEEKTIIQAVSGKEQSFNEYLIRRLDQLENSLNSNKTASFIHNVNPDINTLSNLFNSSIEIEFEDNAISIEEMSSIITNIVQSHLKGWIMSWPGNGVVILHSLKPKDKNSIINVMAALKTAKGFQITNVH
ncbi:hypothetical protein [Mucilaginibacter gotjawali]|uniref:Uncharacterized protein n=2 Tax=Mucilaginibacter gotjawali TaxID=1550579 RepID=A0A839SI76_9SPHI|nr:hypothetical protein [Mucilaginibacter gotjawali]MBB3057965.1 hypothetical protein [Mucilaginibacter gotjawali]BAU52263.1 hypothetical protein MgSA37_00418 [Mucilaginibacter gotjawali]